MNESLVNEGLRDGQKLSIEINIPENGRFIDAFKNCWMSKSSTNIDGPFLTTRKYGFSYLECIIFGQTLKNNNMSLIKKSSKQVLLFFSMTLSILGIGQEAHLDVEGLAKIRGRVDLNLTEDTSVVVIGRNAGINMTFSSSSRKNTFVGSSSGRANTSGYNNSFFGTSAGLSNINGNSNSFFGTSAGVSNVSGSSNVFFGFETGRNNTTGMANSFFGGFRTGENNTTGGSNSFFGNVSGQSNTTGGRNSFYGVFSGASNISGSNNVCLGYSSGRGDSTMSNSTYIGYQAGHYDSGQVERAGNVFLGHKSGKGEIHSNRLYIENSDADSTQALIYGRFDTDELSFNAKVGINTTVPNGQLEVSSNSGLGLPHVLLSELSATDYARLRFENLSVDNNFWDVAGRPKLDGNEATASLNFYYNNPALDVLKLFGDGNATLAGSLTEMSDRRLKKNIVELNEVLPLLYQINGYRYDWIRDEQQKSQIGLIAQEVLEVFPELVKTDDKGMLSVSYSKFVPILLEGIKEQSDIIDSQQVSINEIEKRNKTLISRLTLLEDELKVIKEMLIEEE